MKVQPTPITNKNVELKIVKLNRGKNKPTAVTELNSLFKLKLGIVYSLEKQLIKILPKVIKYTRSMELVTALEIHHSVTKQQIKRLDLVFKLIHENHGDGKCALTSALLTQINEELVLNGETMVRDAGIILAVQQVIHHNIVLYGSLLSFARTLGKYDLIPQLAEALEEEKKTDRDLTQIAETFINPVAAGGYRNNTILTLRSKIMLN